MAFDRTTERSLLAATALLFVASAVVTGVRCESMAAMGEMPMAGGWAMSMAWMRPPQASWLEAGASFAGMWLVMMVAMMQPSLALMLRRYAQAIYPASGVRLGFLLLAVGLGYFFVWAVVGAIAYPVGAALAASAMQHTTLASGAPIAVGIVVVIAGALQFSRWKAHHLECCRAVPELACARPDIGTAWRHGLRLGRHCSSCCANLIAVLLVVGVMDLGAMAVVTAAINVERIAPRADRAARAIGVVAMCYGVCLIALAVAFWRAR